MSRIHHRPYFRVRRVPGRLTVNTMTSGDNCLTYMIQANKPDEYLLLIPSDSPVTGKIGSAVRKGDREHFHIFDLLTYISSCHGMYGMLHKALIPLKGPASSPLVQLKRTLPLSGVIGFLKRLANNYSPLLSEASGGTVQTPPCSYPTIAAQQAGTIIMALLDWGMEGCKWRALFSSRGENMLKIPDALSCSGVLGRIHSSELRYSNEIHITSSGRPPVSEIFWLPIPGENKPVTCKTEIRELHIMGWKECVHPIIAGNSAPQTKAGIIERKI